MKRQEDKSAKMCRPTMQVFYPPFLLKYTSNLIILYVGKEAGLLFEGSLGIDYFCRVKSKIESLSQVFVK